LLYIVKLWTKYCCSLCCKFVVTDSFDGHCGREDHRGGRSRSAPNHAPSRDILTSADRKTCLTAINRRLIS